MHSRRADTDNNQHPPKIMEFKELLAHQSQDLVAYALHCGGIRCFKVQRNQFNGIVKDIRNGAVNSEVTVSLPTGQEIVAAVT